MNFAIPELPEGLDHFHWSIRISASTELDAEKVDRILSAASSDEENQAHSQILVPVEQGGLTFEVSGLIGVHAFPDGDRPPIAHLDLRASVDDRPSSSEKGVAWDPLFEVLAQEVPEVVGRLMAYWQFPKSESSFGVELPIPLDHLPGFSEISGVRLVEKDPKTGEELYYLILQETGEVRSVQVGIELELAIASTLLAEAWERAVSLAALAVDPPLPEG